MNDYKSLKKRYCNDPTFYQMVKLIYNQLELVRLTPSEVRDAAMLACIEFEMFHAPPIDLNFDPGSLIKLKDKK